MNLKTALIIFLGLVLSEALLAGCGDDDDSLGADQLTASHEGWGNPGCWANDCHTDEDTHNGDLQPYECVSCHGKNGAPSGHSGNTPCGDCHPNTHGNNGFPDPESCNTCH